MNGLSQRVRYRMYGVAFLVVVALLLALTGALYTKAFTPIVRVTLQSDRAGLQLLPRSDVKVRGLIVGEVRGTRATTHGAELDLALKPETASLIPGNVQARLLPKTLFGEKYVDLVPPAQPTAPIRSGAVIKQDRSSVAIEINEVLDHLLPLLQAVRPEKLNATLNALATALQGRGDQLGHDIELADSLLTKVNPRLGTLVYDLRALSSVSDVYNAAAPDLLQTLRNLNTTNKTIVDKKAAIDALIPAVTGVSDKATQFGRDNGNKIIGVNIANRQALELVARYSPEFPCVLAGIVKIQPRLSEAAGGGGTPVVNLTVELTKPRPGYKNPLDFPENKDFRNPRCLGLPNPKVPAPEFMTLDGTEDDAWWKTDANGLPSLTGGQSGLPTLPGQTSQTGQTGQTQGSRGRALSGVLIEPGTGMTEVDAIKNVVAPVLRTPANQLSDLAVLMYGPLMQGSVVTVG